MGDIGLGNARCAIGIDVGGTNTDAVILQDGQVLAWHKTPTTSDIQAGVEDAISEVIKKGKVAPSAISSVKIGTTQFVNAVLEQDGRKLDPVAVIRLCGPYSQGSPPFADFPSRLRRLMEGHFGYVDGGFQVEGRPISELSHDHLKEQANIIKSKGVKAIVLVGIYSPANPSQEDEAASYLSSLLGPGYDISCSHRIGRIGFLERENASILNASLRRFARHVIRGFEAAVKKLGHSRLYITLNDGTLSASSEASSHPVRCFSSGPTNSARGAAFLSETELEKAQSGESEVLVVDVGGTTTDICALLKSGFPRQSAAFVKIAGVRTNFTIPDVHSIALGGGSIVREGAERTTVGPDSVGYRLEKEGLFFGGQTLTTTDLVLTNKRTESISPSTKKNALVEIKRSLELAIDQVKTKAGDATVILVGGGSIILPDSLSGVSNLVRPQHLEVANAVGAAIGKISGAVDTIGVPGDKSIDEQLEDAKLLAIERCVEAGGDRGTAEIVDVEVVPVSYVTNGATRLMVRVVADLKNDDTNNLQVAEDSDEELPRVDTPCMEIRDKSPLFAPNDEQASSHTAVELVDVESYRPRIEGDLWHISETDLQFLQDGTGVLGVGSCGEPYPSYLGCLEQLRAGEPIIVQRHDTLPDDAVVLIGGFMGSPTVYLERIPGKHEVTNAINAVLTASNLSSFTALIPNEIGGLNAFEALLAASRLKRHTLDTDAVARAYPFLWQTVRCLNGVSIAPCAVADGNGNQTVLDKQESFEHAEEVMRNACTDLGSLSGMSVNPIKGSEAKTLPANTFSWAWSIGRSIALSRSRKEDPVTRLVEEQNGTLVFTGKIISVTRHVAQGFTRGSTILQSFADEDASPSSGCPSSQLVVEFENENLSAVLKTPGSKDKLLAICPDLITFLDKANGAPLGVSDYKYGLRVSVIALRAPPVWTTERGLKLGGPEAFGLNMPYIPVGKGEYKAPKSVWDLFA